MTNTTRPALIRFALDALIAGSLVLLGILIGVRLSIGRVEQLEAALEQALEALAVPCPAAPLPDGWDALDAPRGAEGVRL